MALRATGRRAGKNSSANIEGRPDARLRVAATHVAEALESRRMLTATPAEIVYTFHHLPPAARHQIAVYEYIDPEFEVRLNADLATYGLNPIQPEAGTLAGFDAQAQSHRSRHSHVIPHARPHAHKRPHIGRLTAQGPTVTDTNYDYNSGVPNYLDFTFDQLTTSTDWTAALKVVRLSDGTTVPANFLSYDSALNLARFQLNYNTTTQIGSPLVSGDYSAILDGSKVTAQNNSTLTMLGSDGVSGHQFQSNFYFGAGDANHDGHTDIFDLNAVLSNFNKTSARFSEGDLTYDGHVDIFDLNMLLGNYGTSTLPLSAPGTPAVTSVADGSIQIAWAPPADFTPTGYDVYRDSTRVGSTSGTTTAYSDAIDSSQLALPHTYFVVAKSSGIATSTPSGILVARTAPQVTSATFSFQTLPQQLTFNFNQPMSATWSSALSLINLKTGTSVSPATSNYTASPPSVTYGFSTPLPDGNYAAILKGSQITAADGTPMAGTDHVGGDDYFYNFYVLKGDLALTGERAVGTGDLSTAQANQGNAGTYSSGDVNYDGTVGADDVSFISGASQAITTLPLLGPAGTPTLYTAGNNSITIAWPASSDSTVVKYDVYRDYAPIPGDVAATTYPDTGLATGSSHIYFVVGKDANGQTSYISPELRASATQPAPSDPTNPLDVQVTANSILLAWTDDDPNVTSYTITRDDLSTSATVTTTAYYDTGLTANTTYTYHITANTAVGGHSNPLSHTITTPAASSLPSGYVTAPPDQPVISSVVDTPAGDKNTLVVNWSAISGSGIRYEIDRNGIPVGGTTSTTFTDKDATAGTTYQYKVIAYDPAYNQSTASAAVSKAAVDVTPPAAPLDFQATVSTTSLTLNWIAPGDNVGVDHYLLTQIAPFGGATTTETTTSHTFTGLTPGTTYTYSIVAVDAAGNRSDAASPAPVVTAVIPGGNVAAVDSAPNQYIPPEWQDYFYRPGDGLTAVLRQKMSHLSITPPTSANWFDLAADTLLTSAQPASSETQIHGTSGDYAYWDQNSNGKWDSGEPVWNDANHNQIFDASSETRLSYTGSGTSLPDQTVGRNNGLSSSTRSGSPIVWVDGTSFRQDLVAFYTSMESFIPNYAPANSTSAYTVGSFLAALGLPVIGEGTISSFSTSSVTVSGQNDVAAGNQIQLGGNWYSVLSVSGSTIQVTPNIAGSPTGTFSVIDWTKVPEFTDSATGLAFHYARGKPDPTTAIFSQQLNELGTALNALVYFPQGASQWRFDLPMSQRFISLATTALDTYRSVYGATAAQTQSLYQQIMAGSADPGSTASNLLSYLRSTVGAVASVIYVTDSSGGWDLYQGNPHTFTAPNSMLPGAIWPAPALTGTIQSSDLDGVESVLNAILSNGLWIAASGTANYNSRLPLDSPVGKGTGVYQLSNIGTPLSNWQDNVPISPVPGGPAGFPGLPLGTWSQYAVLGFLVFHNESENLPSQTGPQGNYWWAGGGVVTVNTPSSTNNHGGSPMGALRAGPHSVDDGEDSWTWGVAAQQVATYTESHVHDLLQDAYTYALSNLSSLSLPIIDNTDPHLQISTAGSTSSGAYDLSTNAVVQYPSLPSLYGQVPKGAWFSYTGPANSAGAGPGVGTGILTTQMDYQNVQPDVNVDGIVNVPVDLDSFGNDTGVMGFQAERLAGQTYLPIFTSTGGALPYHGYIQQGRSRMPRGMGS